MLTPERDRIRDPETILVTGASSGIGAALALEYAAPGRRLVLIGRNLDRLDAVCAGVREKGAEVHSATIDITDRAFLADWLTRVDNQTPIDLVIANAGISGGGVQEDRNQAERVFATNIDGMLNTIHPLLGPMTARGRGQIALMGSLAGLRGFPGAPAYCASKAAVLSYGDSLRVGLKPSNIKVSVILPGFVVSPMTDRNPYRMPFLVSSEKAALIIRRRLAKGHGRIAFPRPMAFAARLTSILPWPIADWILKDAPAKPPLESGD